MVNNNAKNNPVILPEKTKLFILLFFILYLAPIIIKIIEYSAAGTTPYLRSIRPLSLIGLNISINIDLKIMYSRKSIINVGIVTSIHI